jgi:hypothetical protein
MARIKTTVVCIALIVCFSGISLADAPNPTEGDWVADVAAKVLPSVVNIASMKTVTQQSPYSVILSSETSSAAGYRMSESSAPWVPV